MWFFQPPDASQSILKVCTDNGSKKDYILLWNWVLHFLLSVFAMSRGLSKNSLLDLC